MAPPQNLSEEAFVRHHLRSIWRYLRMHGAPTSDADDLVQETFVIALQKGAQRFDRAASAVFLRRTARFVFLRHLRRHERDLALADAVEELWSREAQHDGGDALVAALSQCVERLQGRVRTAVRWTYGIGEPARPREQIARELELLPNGLKTLLQRARQALRACIERTMR